MKDFIEVININGFRGILNISLISEVSEIKNSGMTMLVYNNHEITLNERYDKFLSRLTEIANVEEI